MRLVSLVLCSFIFINCQKSNDSLNNEESCSQQSSLLEIADNREIDRIDLLDNNNQRWILTVKENAPELIDLLESYNINDIEEISEDSLSVTLPTGLNKNDLLDELNNNEALQSIEVDHPVMANDIVSSERANTQWHHQRIKTFDLWNYTQGLPSVTVAVIDSGVDTKHPDLKNQMWVNPHEIKNGKDDDGNGLIDDINGWNYVDRKGNPSPTANVKGAYHGTHVAGIIAGAETLSGYTGISPKIKIMGLRFLDNNKTGFTSNAVKAVNYAVDNGAKIINLSWGSQKKNTALMSALRRARDKGVLVIAASGNLGKNTDATPFYPASYGYSNIISVTASTQSDKLLSGINYGARSVHIAAPGADIYSTDRNNKYYSRSGSSMAAPVVAGVAAILLSMEPELTGYQLRSLLLNGADRLSSLSGKSQYGRRLNGKKSIENLLSSTPDELPKSEEEEDPSMDGGGTPILETETCEVSAL